MLRARKAGDLGGDGDAAEGGNAEGAQVQPEADVGVRNMSASHRTGLAKIKNVVGMPESTHCRCSPGCGSPM